MSNVVILDARVNSYAGQPTRLVATLNMASGLVYISDEKPFIPPQKKYSIVEMLKIKKREQRTLIITDSADTLDKWDLLFREAENLTEIVRAYQQKENNGLLKIDPAVLGRYNPQNVLQQRKLDVKNGAQWELSTETQNGHVCILLACWGALRVTSNFSFATQVNENLDQAYLDEDSDELDEPFTI